MKNIHQYNINNIVSSFQTSKIYEKSEIYNLILDDIINPFIFYKYKPEIKNNSFNLSEDADFIVSIYSTKDDIIEIILDDKNIITQKLQANNYFILKTNPIPSCCLLFSKVNKINILTKDYGDIHIIYSDCYIDLSKYLKHSMLITNIFDDENEIQIIYNQGHVYNNKKDIDNCYKMYNFDKNLILKIPNFYFSDEKYRKYLAKKTSELINLELLEITLHPDRITSFMSTKDLNKFKN